MQSLDVVTTRKEATYTATPTVELVHRQQIIQAPAAFCRRPTVQGPGRYMSHKVRARKLAVSSNANLVGRTMNHPAPHKQYPTLTSVDTNSCTSDKSVHCVLMIQHCLVWMASLRGQGKPNPPTGKILRLISSRDPSTQSLIPCDAKAVPLCGTKHNRCDQSHSHTGLVLVLF